MTRLPAPLRRAAALVAAASFVAVLSACNTGQAPAAKVNGHEISGKQLVQGAPLFATLLASQNPSGGSTGVARIDMATTAQYLTLLVDDEGYRQELDRRGIKITSAQRDSARSQLAQQFAGSAATKTAKAVKGFKDLPGWFQDELVDLVVRNQAFSDLFTNSPDVAQKARAYYDANKATTLLGYCIDVIQTSSAASGQAARDRIDGGTPFATVAKDVAAAESTQAAGTRGDGDVGCPTETFLSQRLGPAITANLVTLGNGDFLGPVEVQTGVFLLIRSRGKGTSPFADLQSSLVSQMAAQAQSEVEQKLFGHGHVEIDPRYGRWVESNGAYSVVAPSGAERPPSTTKAAATLGGGTAGSGGTTGGGTTGGAGAAN